MLLSRKKPLNVFVSGLKSACRSCTIRSYSAYKEYSDTLNLPRTKFPNRSKASVTARLIQETGSELYEWQQKNLPADSLKVLHDGPPYANGDLHLGHALNKTLKDIINRYNVVRGNRVSYVPGWDCHGLPIEQKALENARKKHGSKVDDYTIYKKRELANKLANEMSSKQLLEFKKFAVMADWDGGNIYRTLTSDYVVRQLRVFRSMLAGGLISRQERPVYWSVESATALAESELQYGDHASTTVQVKYPLNQASPELSEILASRNIDPSEVSLLIWTTTPWTLVANRAIAVNPEMEYGLVDAKGHGRLIVARALYDEIPDANPLGLEFSGSSLINSTYKCLLRNGAEVFPVLAANYVTNSSGTGLVHTAPGHGNEDYLLCKEHGIEAYSPVDDKGRYNSAVHENLNSLVGLDARSDGQNKVLELAEQANIIVKLQKINHSVPSDWRSKTPVIVRSTPQFFADVESIKKSALAALENVKFTPASGKSRLSAFTMSRSEWCISRQRAWGVPIPVVYDKETGEPLMNLDTVDHIIGHIEKIAVDFEYKHGEPLNQWFKPQEDISDWLPEGYNGTKYRKGTDTMDVWFDSGTSWTMLEQRFGGNHLADYYLEGSDQHRGWFQSSLLTKIAVDKDQDHPSAPFKNVITHGFLLDEHGKKMSKSIGNTILPQDLISGSDKVQAIGVDGLRLWVAQSDYTTDVTLSPFIISQVGALVKKLRLTYKYLLGNLSVGDYDGSAIEYEDLSPIDQKALSDVYKLNASIIIDYENFNFSRMVKSVQNHMNSGLSAFYFDIVKDRLYADSRDGQSRRSVQYVLAEILKTYTTILAPITPILSQEVWQASPSYVQNETDSPFKNGLLKHPRSWDNKEIDEDFEVLIDLRKTVNETIEMARTDKKVGSSLAADVYLENGDQNTIQLLEKYHSHLADIFITSHAYINKKVPAGLWIYHGERNGIKISVTASHDHKCPRCWKFTAEEEEALCKRCDEVVV